MRDQTFRRGLLYAVDREMIVRQLICGGREILGFEQLSGPFPLGTEENDLIGYAYDYRVPATEFDSRMGIIAPAVVLGQMRKAVIERLTEERVAELGELKDDDERHKKLEEWADADPSLKIPQLVLAYPDTDLARTACQSMQQMWKAVGMEVQLKPLPPGVTRPADDDYDLLYTELTMEEPLSDARKVFGDLGIVSDIGPAIEQLMGDLDLAKNWVEARNILRQIHELCQYDMVVLPLWQTINYYAYRRHVSGIDSELIHLYEHVDQWGIEVPAVAGIAPSTEPSAESTAANR
jgi:ABC-type oligopeptide transport system substrate-binding subunit